MPDPRLLSAEEVATIRRYLDSHPTGSICSDDAIALLSHIAALETSTPTRERAAFSRGRFWGVWHPEEDAFAGDAEAARRYPDPQPPEAP